MNVTSTANPALMHLIRSDRELHSLFLRVQKCPHTVSSKFSKVFETFGTSLKDEGITKKKIVENYKIELKKMDNFNEIKEKNAKETRAENLIQHIPQDLLVKIFHLSGSLLSLSRTCRDFATLIADTHPLNRDLQFQKWIMSKYQQVISGRPFNFRITSLCTALLNQGWAKNVETLLDNHRDKFLSDRPLIEQSLFDYYLQSPANSTEELEQRLGRLWNYLSTRGLKLTKLSPIECYSFNRFFAFAIENNRFCWDSSSKINYESFNIYFWALLTSNYSGLTKVQALVPPLVRLWNQPALKAFKNHLMVNAPLFFNNPKNCAFPFYLSLILSLQKSQFEEDASLLKEKIGPLLVGNIQKLKIAILVEKDHEKAMTIFDSTEGEERIKAAKILANHFASTKELSQITYYLNLVKHSWDGPIDEENLEPFLLYKNRILEIIKIEISINPELAEESINSFIRRFYDQILTYDKNNEDSQLIDFLNYVSKELVRNNCETIIKNLQIGNTFSYAVAAEADLKMVQFKFKEGFELLKTVKSPVNVYQLYFLDYFDRAKVDSTCLENFLEKLTDYLYFLKEGQGEDTLSSNERNKNGESSQIHLWKHLVFLGFKSIFRYMKDNQSITPKISKQYSQLEELHTWYQKAPKETTNPSLKCANFYFRFLKGDFRSYDELIGHIPEIFEDHFLSGEEFLV